MKHTLLIITALMLVVGCSEDLTYESDLYEKDGVYYHEDSDKPYTGKTVDMDNYNTIRLSGLYENGVLVGEYTFYNVDGSVIKPVNIVELVKDPRGYFVPGVPDGNADSAAYWGYAFSLYSNGQKASEGIFKDGHRDGLWTWWYENGQKEKEGVFSGGQWSFWDGKVTHWYPGGQKSSEGTYKDGEKDGLYTRWYPGGQKSKEGTYKDGKQDGKRTEWFPDGDMRSRKIWKNGKCCFDQFGNPASYHEFVD